MNLSALPNLSLVFRYDGGLTLAPDDPGTVLRGRSATVRLSNRDMLVEETPDMRQFNATATAFAGRPIFGHAVVLPVNP